MKATGKRMPLKSTNKATGSRISKGAVRPAAPKQASAGFPTQQSSAYRTMRPPQNLMGGSNALRPIPVRPKKSPK